MVSVLGIGSVMVNVLGIGSVMVSVLGIGSVMVNVLGIGSVMVSVLASSVIDCGCEARSGQTKEYKIGNCCFSAKHAALRSKSKDWLARNQNNVSEWSDISTRGLLFQ
jgi:hypothetical protein